MHLAQVVLPLILGLVVISWQHVQAEDILSLKGNSSKPVNRTVFGGANLYMAFACRGKTNGLRLPIPGSCVDYYQCEQGVANRLTCTDGKQFSSLALTCMDARLTKCVEKDHDDLVECDGVCCSREDGLYPVEGTCSDFIVCINGYTVQKSCGGNLEFSAQKLICDIPSRAGCSKAVIDGENQVVQEEEKESDMIKPTMYKISHRVCHNKPNGLTVPIVGSCNKFYVCISGIGYLKSCGNLQFNPMGYCDSKTRIFCPADEEGDVILDEEFVKVDTRPLPVPRPKPLPMHPVEDEFDSPPYPEEEETKEEEEEIKSELPIQEEVVEEEEKVVEEEEEPTKEQPSEVEKEDNEEKPRPPIAAPRPPVPGPLLEKEEHLNEQKPQPPVVNEKEDQEQKTPENETKPAENEDDHTHENRPRPPIAIPKPPVVLQPESEDQVPVSVKNICANQSVGALMAMPENCSKYIRCRWDWFEKRVAVVMSCPEDMHFNAKTKQCDSPAEAGCIVYSKKTVLRNKKRNKFAKAF